MTNNLPVGQPIVLSDVLAKVPDKPPVGELLNSVVTFLESHRIPSDIVSDLKASAYDEWIPIGPLLLIPMPRLVDETSGIPACIGNGFLPLAGGANGDPVVVERATRRMCYVPWGELPLDDPQFTDLHSHVHRTPFNYDEFWEAAVSQKPFPSDSYEAQDLWPVSK